MLKVFSFLKTEPKFDLMEINAWLASGPYKVVSAQLSIDELCKGYVLLEVEVAANASKAEIITSKDGATRCNLERMNMLLADKTNCIASISSNDSVLVCFIATKA